MTTAIDEKDAELVEAEEAEAEFAAEVEEEDTEPESNPAGEFSLVLVDETKPTVDGRYFVPDKVTWREPPIPLLYTTSNGNGHKGAEIGGAITKVWREEGKIKGFGHFESGEKGQELRRLITEGVLTGVSADVGGAMVELEAANKYGKEMQKITEGRILGVTALPLQAYDDTRIAVTAAAIPAAPPKEWFENPRLKKVTPISVTADGRVYGHVAAWGTCHVGFNRPGECLTPPHSSSNYAHFTIGEVLTAEGDTVPTGPITLGTGHAGLTLNANAARDHYDNTGTAVADVTAGEDQYGIWVSGAMRPSVTDDKIREFRASAPSGDWRSIGGALEMVGVLAVNVPGFPIPRAKVEFSDEQPLSLVAAGFVPTEEFDADCGCPAEEDCGCDDADTDTAPPEPEPEPEVATETELSLTEQLSALEAQMEELAAKMLAEGEFRNYEIPNKKSTGKEITGHHGHHPHGTSILWPAMYEELRKKGMTKEKAARISNANWNRKHKAPGNATSTRVTASAEVDEEFINNDTEHEKRDFHGRFADTASKKAKRFLAKASGNAKNDDKKAANHNLAGEIAALRAKKAEIVAKYGSQSREAEDITAQIDSWRRVNLAAVTEEFVNRITSREKRDGRGRWTDSGGIGSLTGKARSLASRLESKDGSARERADWKRHSSERSAGNSEVAKAKATRQAELEKIKARRAARSGAATENTTAPKSASSALREILDAPRKGNPQQSAHGRPGKGIGGSPTRSGVSRGAGDKVKKPNKKAEAQANIDALMAKAKQREAARRGQSGPARISRVEAAEKMFGTGSKQHESAKKRFPNGGPTTQVASPKPSQPVYRSMAEKVAERDGSVREKAAWSRQAKDRELGKSELAKQKAEKAARKAMFAEAKRRRGL